MWDKEYWKNISKVTNFIDAGLPIQRRLIDSNEPWEDVQNTSSLHLGKYNYRIKPLEWN